MTVGKRAALPPRLQAWADACSRHHLSHVHVQMARELGMNPAKLGKLDNHRQEPWKAPLPDYIEHLYAKRFGRDRPDQVVSIEEQARRDEQFRAQRKAAKAAAKAAEVITGVTAAEVGSPPGST